MILFVSAPQPVHTQVASGNWCLMNKSAGWNIWYPTRDYSNNSKTCDLISQGRMDPRIENEQVGLCSATC